MSLFVHNDGGNFDDSFDKLKTLIGEQIVVIYWDCGNIKGYRGILEEVIPYDCLRLVNIHSIDFVGERTAIEYILDKDINIVYLNSAVAHYKGNYKDPKMVIYLQKKYLGYSVNALEYHKIRGLKR